MAVKRKMSAKKKEPVKRSIKRAATEVDAFLDDESGEAEMADIVAQEDVEAMAESSPEDAIVDFQDGPLTPEQMLEKETLEGRNAVAKMSNDTLPARRSIDATVKAFTARNRSKRELEEFMALPLEARRVIIDKEQAESKAGRRVIKRAK